MLQQLGRWSRQTKKWLWFIVITGLIAATPLAVQRVQTEQSANQAEFVFNYRNIAYMSAQLPKDNRFIEKQCDRLQAAGVQTMVLPESNLFDLRAARRLMIYNSVDVATSQQKLPPIDENYTYILFTSLENKKRLSPMIKKTFKHLGIGVRPWQLGDRGGLILETPMELAMVKPMLQDPIAVEELRNKGFAIMPRLAGNIEYDQVQMSTLLHYYHSIGVKRIILEGEALIDPNDDNEKENLAHFAQLLNKYNIGLTVAEGLGNSLQGIDKLAPLINYNIVRMHVINDEKLFKNIDVLADRISLATKDRNIRIIYFNVTAGTDLKRSKFIALIDNVVDTLQAPAGNAYASIEKNGFTIGEAIPFTVVVPPWQKMAKLIVGIGGIALVAIMISYFIPYILFPAFMFGLIGGTGLYILKPILFEQALALAVAISSLTIAMVWAVRNVHMSPPVKDIRARCGKAIKLFLQTTLLSLIAIPFIIALLNDVAYMVVLEQFRGIKLLYAVPILLTTVYTLLYRSTSICKEARRLLKAPITVLSVFIFGVTGLVGGYYLLRTGNIADISSFEKGFRSLLENTLGVRPRSKEFLLAHPLFLIAAFVAYRYRAAIYALIIAVIGQLSIVDTFAHIHTPIIISTLRILLGLSFGLIIGMIGIFVWSIIERYGNIWLLKLQRL